MTTSVLDRLIEITTDFTRERGVNEIDLRFDAHTAISQDALIFGIDVEDYASVLGEEFGEIVWEIPWLRYTDQTSSFRGFGCAFVPFWFVWRFLRWPLAGGNLIERPHPRTHPLRLELGHIAKVIEQGHWSAP